MWEKISGLISIVVVEYVCVYTCASVCQCKSICAWTCVCVFDSVREANCYYIVLYMEPAPHQ